MLCVCLYRAAMRATTCVDAMPERAWTVDVGALVSSAVGVGADCATN